MQAGEKILFGEHEWRVLEVQNDRALIITERIIEQRPYHNRADDVTWSECELREYLNGAFFDALGENSKSRVLAVTNKNSDNQWYASRGGADTVDRVFLLSLEEAVCKYFGDSSKNLQNRSAKQRYWFQKRDENNTRRRSALDGYSWWWWLRSPGRDNKRAVYIHGDGNVGIQGNRTFKYGSSTVHPTGNNSGGVRPALWIRL